MAGRDFATGTLPVYSHTEDVQALTIDTSVTSCSPFTRVR